MINYKNNYINPTLVIFVQAERNFYKMISKLFKNLGKLDLEFNELDIKRQVPEVDYDPFKYIRGINLLDKNNLSVLKEIKSLKFLQPEKIKIEKEKEILPTYTTTQYREYPEYQASYQEEEVNSEVFMSKSNLDENLVVLNKSEIPSSFSYIQPHFEQIQTYETKPTEEREEDYYRDVNSPRYHSPKPHAEKKSPELSSKKRYIV
jgi:hypothetical protein